MIYWLSQHLLDWSHGTSLGEPAFVAAALSLHHGAQRGGGCHGAPFELVVWAGNHSLAQATEIRPGIQGQSRGGWRPGRARPQQEGDAHHGRHLHYNDFDGDHRIVDPIGQQTGFADAAFCARADRPGILRRLRQDHPAKRRRNAAPCEALRPNRRQYFYWYLPVANAFHGQTGFGNRGALLQVSRC